MKVIGLDLSSNEDKFSGLCVLNESLEVKTLLLKSNKEIISYIKDLKPQLVAIDAPLSLPKSKGFRRCDKEVLKLGIKLFPPLFIKSLTLRGIEIKKSLENLGFEVIEVYPGAFRGLLNLPKRKEIIKDTLIKWGIKGIRIKVNLDELDAIIAALIGLMYLRKEAIILGDKEEGYIVIPKLY